MCPTFVKNLKMTKTSLLFSIHQETTCTSCLYSIFIILTHFHIFTVIEDKIQNGSIFKISAKVCVCDLGRNLKMMKIS